MSAFGDPDEIHEDELPERIIVVRDEIGSSSSDPDSAAAELDALAAEVAAEDSGDDDADAVRTIDIDAPSDPDELQAELDALAVEVGAEPIDLDEVDLRSAPMDFVPEAEPAAPVIDLADPDLLDGVDDDVASLGHLEPIAGRGADAESSGHLDPLGGEDADSESLGHLDPIGDDTDDRESLGHLDPIGDDTDDRESLGHLEPIGDDTEDGETLGQVDPIDDGEAVGHLTPDGGDTETPSTSTALEDLAVATAALGRIGSAPHQQQHQVPGRDETGPGALRPLAPEPVVIAARSTRPPSMARRTVSRLRALIGLVIVVILAGVGLAGAIGAAVLLVVLVLSRAFGSGA